MRICSVLTLLALTVGCSEEKTIAQSWVSSDRDAPRIRFHPIPESRYLPEQTALLRRVHRITAESPPPPMVAYSVRAALDEVADHFIRDGGLPQRSSPLAAPVTSGDLSADVATLAPLLSQAGLDVPDIPSGTRYAAMTLPQTSTRPRISLQRPYYDVETGLVVDQTLVVMVRE